jgi:hypothetical protein
VEGKVTDTCHKLWDVHGHFMGIEPGWRFLAEEVVVAEIGAKTAERKIVPSKRDTGDSNIFIAGAWMIGWFPLIKDVLIRGYKLLYERNAANTICHGMVHDKGKKGALWRPHEQDLEGDMRGEVDRKIKVIVHMVVDCLLDREIRFRQCNLLYDVLAPNLCVFPAVTKPALVRRVVINQDTFTFGVVIEGSVQCPVGNVRAYFTLQRHYPRVDKMKTARNTFHAVG